MTNQLEAKIKHFDKVVTCLAAQVPRDVYDDVKKHWEDLKQKIQVNEPRTT
jgi:hypothetical protein